MEDVLLAFIDPLIGGALIAGVGSFFGGERANQKNLEMQKDQQRFNREEAMRATAETKVMQQNAMDFSRQEAQTQMAFQEKMSNTAYQRAMNDMREAGLNPMLAFQQGGANAPMGASGSASGGSGTAGNSGAARMEDSLGKGVSSALDFARYKREMASADSQIALNNAAKASAEAQEKLNLANAKQTETTNKALQNQMGAIKSKAQLDEASSKLNLDLLNFDAILNRANTAAGIIPSAKSLFRGKGGGGSSPGKKMDDYHGKKWIPVYPGQYGTKSLP